MVVCVEKSSSIFKGIYKRVKTRENKACKSFPFHSQQTSEHAIKSLCHGQHRFNVFTARAADVSGLSSLPSE